MRPGTVPRLLLGLLLATGTAAAVEQATWRFTDVTAESGLVYQQGYRPPVDFAEIVGGVAAGDYDGDGHVDLYVVRGDIGPNLLFRNRGDGSFAEVGAAAGVALAGVRSAGPLFADLDGDGRLDLIVGGIEGTAVSIFHNAGDGTFADVTAASGLVLPAGRDTYSISAGDYDHDGDLDLFLTHWVSSAFDVPGQSSFHLWQNDGSGRFTDVTLAAGIVARGPGDLFYGFTANFTDIDGDRWPDLLVTGDFGTSRIYRNDRAGGFALATDPAVVTDENAMGAAVGDYDGDGDLDWFVSSIWDPNGVAEGNWGTSGNRLYRNRGDGSFDDATDTARVRAGYWGWGSTFQDFDNDGDLDLFQVNGFGDAAIPQNAEFVIDPSVFFVGNGDGTFSERGAALGVADTEEGRGVVAFDYDGDGDLDLFVHDNGAPGRLYRNDGGNAGGWLDVVLRGRAPNTEGIGAWVRVTAGGRTQLRELRAGSNYASQDPAVAHVGLGSAASASVEVLWPDGTRSVRAGVPSNQRLVIAQAPPGAEDRARRNCMLALNAAGAKLGAAVGTRLVGCVAEGLAGTLPPGTSAQACLGSDPGGRIAAAASSSAVAETAKCSLTPGFGPTTATAVNLAMGQVLRPGDLFGPDLDAALRAAAADPAAARCQVAAAKSLAKIAAAKVKAFNACKAMGLQRGTIRRQADLDACHATTTGPLVGKVVNRTQKTLARACAGVDLAAALPGRCGGGALASLGTCVEEHAACGACTALAGADGLGIACHRFQDGVATLFCGDRPVTGQSIARQWNEMLLDAIRRDTPRPPVHARNLHHLAGAMWDAWRAYGGGGSPWRADESLGSADPARDRATAISFAAYRLLAHRFTNGPGAAVTQAALRAKMYALGYDADYTATTGDAPAAVGNRIAAAVIAFGLGDGANEAGNYADPTYAPINPPLIVKQPGTTMVDPNRWQPLALDQIVTQNGIPLPDKVQTFVGAGWNRVTPFALTRIDPAAVYLDPGPPPLLGGMGDALFKERIAGMLADAAQLTPDDGVRIDISPAAWGNNPLGTNDGHGYAVNPVTGAPYTPQVVPRGDFARVLAEFWADGPTSETPPGHWNVIANTASDDPLLERRIGGAGPIVDRLEWDVKLGLALNGAVHDAAIQCWGVKRLYDSVRPISMIRHMGGLGQSSDPAGPSYHPSGLPLLPGLIEVVTPASAAPGQRHAALAAHVGEIAVLSWPGEPASPASEYSGVRWVRAVEWLPYQRKTFVTPPFAAYPSGHSTYSRAAAEVLTRFTGSAYFPGGLGEHVVPQNAFLKFEIGPSEPLRLQWARYYDAADQAGISRLYGGIHTAADDFAGRIAGASIGAQAYAKAIALFAGSPAP